MMKCYNKLDCVVREQAPTSNKVKTATEIAIFIGPVLVATKVIGGRYTAEQGLAEFRRNPKTFKQHAGYETATALRLVA
jgi:hypothetical protein